MTENCLCIHIMGRRRCSRWHDCGKHFAQPVKKKKILQHKLRFNIAFCFSELTMWLLLVRKILILVTNFQDLKSGNAEIDFNGPSTAFPWREREFSERSEWSHISVEQICACMAPLARPSVKIYRRNLHRVCCTRCTNVIFVGMGVKNTGLHVSLRTFPNKQTSFHKCEPLLDSAGAKLSAFSDLMKQICCVRWAQVFWHGASCCRKHLSSVFFYLLLIKVFNAHTVNTCAVFPGFISLQNKQAYRRNPTGWTQTAGMCRMARLIWNISPPSPWVRARKAPASRPSEPGWYWRFCWTGPLSELRPSGEQHTTKRSVWQRWHFKRFRDWKDAALTSFIPSCM